jgi:hypothetical protein
MGEVRYKFGSRKGASIMHKNHKYHTNYIYIIYNLHGLSPRANYTDRAIAACQRSKCQLFADRGCRLVIVTDHHGRILGFLDRRYIYIYIYIYYNINCLNYAQTKHNRT